MTPIVIRVMPQLGASLTIVIDDARVKAKASADRIFKVQASLMIVTYD